jgi:nucleoside-diphosphate-sugar epimerase
VRILLTGASSFTGAWFASALADAGHEVTATFRRPAAAYAGLEAERLALLAGRCRPLHGVAFGDEEFVRLAGSGFDLVCHHGAQVESYRDPDFDVAAALAANTRGARDVLVAMAASGCRKLLVTGTVFESGEGQGDGELQAFGGYGLSKAFTWQALAHLGAEAGVDAGKFVVPNPFGPYEQERFVAYLMRRWAAGEPAEVATPAYVRDHVHASLLAGAYAGFAERLVRSDGTLRSGPQWIPRERRRVRTPGGVGDAAPHRVGMPGAVGRSDRLPGAARAGEHRPGGGRRLGRGGGLGRCRPVVPAATELRRRGLII